MAARHLTDGVKRCFWINVCRQGRTCQFEQSLAQRPNPLIQAISPKLENELFCSAPRTRARRMDRGRIKARCMNVETKISNVLRQSLVGSSKRSTTRRTKPHSSDDASWAETCSAGTTRWTSRVIVNRIWHPPVRRGIVGTNDNFGRLGQTPRILNCWTYLAHEFRTHQTDGRSSR